MDEADIAQATMESLHQHMIAASRKPAPTPTGRCLYCDTQVHEEALFCDKDCHRDYEYEQSIRSKQTATVEFFGGYIGPGFAGERQESEDVARRAPVELS